jgi:hypothetical protein
VTVAQNNANDILTYSIGTNTGVVNSTNHTVAVTVPFGTNVTNLIATFTLSPQASATVGGVNQVSGSTANNFSGPVTYAVAAGSGAVQNWTVTVTIAQNTANDILTYSIGTNTGVVNPTNHTVAVTVPFGTNLTNLIATFTLSPQASATVGGVNQVSGSTSNNFSGPVTYAVAAGSGAVQNWTVTVTQAPNTETDIIAYSIPGQTGPADINIGNHTVNVVVPYGTTMTGLVATFNLSPQASATVGGTTQVSGNTPNNFTSPVIYIIEAGDGTTQDWTVTVSLAPNTETDILTYSLDGFTGVVNASNHTVLITVPYGTNVTNMVATFTLSAQAIARVSGSVQQSGVSSLNFSSPVTYNITAGDGTTIQPWIVTVDIAPNIETDIESYSFQQQTGPAVINTNNHTIYIQVQYGTSLTNLVASFVLSYGATASITGTLQSSGVTVNNFTSPVTYRIIAEDGTTFQDWTINVSVEPNFATDIITFSIPDEIGSSVVNSGSHSVVIVMPYGTNVSNLISSFTLSPGATARINGIVQNSGVTSNDFSNDVVYSITAENGVDMQDWTIQVSVAPNTNTGILIYSFNEISKPSIIDNNNHTIDVFVVYGTDLTNLTATFTLSVGAVATIGTVNQVSGTTTNNFTDPITYTVTAMDGITTQDWVVTVTVSENTEADFLNYSFDEETGPATIDITDNQINIEVAFGTDVSNLIATFTLSDFASAKVGVDAQTSGITANNFTNTVTYIVTSQDSSNSKIWYVTVTIAYNTDTDILTYSFPEQTEPASIDYDQHNIDAEVEYGIDRTHLIASFTLSPQATAYIGPVRQESEVTENDFTNPVTYTVQAGDNTTLQDWTVNVSYSPPNNKTEILSFTFEQQIGDAIIDTSSNEVTIILQKETEFDRLVATFELSKGSKIFVDGVEQVSGETVNDFSNGPIEYTIIAQDSITTQTWTVSVVPAFDFEYILEPREFPVSSDSIKTSVGVPDFRTIEKVIFYYKKFEEENWTQVDVQGNLGIYEINITRNMAGNLGMYYYFNAVDTSGSIQPVPYRQMILHHDTDYPQIPDLRFGETVNQYQIISIPLNLQNANVEGVFDELGEYNIKYWRLFHHDGISTNEYQSGFTNIEPGLGYWLIVREPTTITTGEGRTIRVDSISNAFELDLEPGWNQVGNPFDIDISWDDVILNNNNNRNIQRVKLFYGDSLSVGSIIPRYRGGFVFLDGVQPITVNLRPSSINAIARKQPYIDADRFSTLDNPSWIAGLKISDGNVTNTLSGIGMHPEAVEGKDHHDEVLMPVPKQIIPFQLAFNHPDEKYDKFSLDVITTTDHYIWEFEVKSFNPSQTLTISWDNRYFGDNEYHLILNHLESESLIDMKESISYTFNAKGTDQFRIIFGNKTFVDNELKPKSVTFGHGYPNPFRDLLVIPFTLPEDNSEYIVKISVFDLTGNMVKQLTNKTYRPGYYTITWNSLDDVSGLHHSIYIIKMVVRADKTNTVISRKVIRY